MKAFAAAILALFLFSGCEKAKEEVDQLTEFDISYSTDVPVPAISYTANVPVDITSPEISTNTTSKFTSENTTASLVKEIKLTKFKFSTSTGSIDFIKSLNIYIRSSNNSDVLVASKSNIPAGATSVSADLQNVNIKDFLVKDKISFRLHIEWASSISGDKQIKTEETVHVKATLIK